MNEQEDLAIVKLGNEKLWLEIEKIRSNILHLEKQLGSKNLSS